MKLIRVYNPLFLTIFFVSVNVLIQVNALILRESFAITQGLPFFIITVDVETTKYGNNSSALPLPEQVHAICEDNIPCGMQKMIDLLQEYNLSATFFFNVYEYKKYGEGTVMKIVQWLDESGQDIQLHTHPQWAYDNNRHNMYQYSLNEQIEIIKRGKALLQKWTGKPVIAHRAGAYGADRNTLEALIKNNIFYDSSLFWKWPNSKIGNIGLQNNSVSMFGPLYEFPVTVYQKEEYPALLGDLVKPVLSIRKYDVDWFADKAEAESAMNEAINSDLDFIILFLHSFSFIKNYNEKGEMRVDTDSIILFQELMSIIKRRNVQVLTFGDIVKNDLNMKPFLDGTDYIPEVISEVNSVQYVCKRAGITRQNYKFYMVLSGLIVCMISATFILYRKRRNADG